jgi:hypothetical protein
MTVLMRLITAWDDYFSGTPTSLSSTLYTSRQTPSATSVYVSSCLFKSITTASYGGALYFTSTNYLLIESTSFFSCKTSGQCGAAVYFNNDGQCVLYEVCGYDCSPSEYTSTSLGQFAYLGVVNGAAKNYFNYSSISRCVNERTNSLRMIYFQNGKVYCPSVNSSMNKCYLYSGIVCNPTRDCSISYSTFADNIASGYNCILLDRSGANSEIKCCNIIRNTQVDINTEGTIRACGNTIIENSCILENTATRIFHQTSSSYTITLSKCTVDSTSNNGYLTIQNTVTKSFILALNHMSTRNCHSEYDSAGTLTPIIQTPSSSKKQRNYCSCEKIFNQQLSEKFSLIILFFFNFIYP